MGIVLLACERTCLSHPNGIAQFINEPSMIGIRILQLVPSSLRHRRHIEPFPLEAVRRCAEFEGASSILAPEPPRVFFQVDEALGGLGDVDSQRIITEAGAGEEPPQ